MTEKFKPIGNWVAVETTIKEEKESEAGIIYTDNQLSPGMHVWSRVHSVGNEVKEDIIPGDMVYWKLGSNQGAYYKTDDITLDMVTADNILVVDRDETN
tara:strand:- start:13604 stop:13900 length:297 start_codon:yes stop_codon:yes gene_type:complete